MSETWRGGKPIKNAIDMRFEYLGGCILFR